MYDFGCRVTIIHACTVVQWPARKSSLLLIMYYWKRAPISSINVSFASKIWRSSCNQSHSCAIYSNIMTGLVVSHLLLRNKNSMTNYYQKQGNNYSLLMQLIWWCICDLWASARVLSGCVSYPICPCWWWLHLLLKLVSGSHGYDSAWSHRCRSCRMNY